MPADDHQIPFLLLIALTLCAPLITTLVHELGHALAAKLRGVPVAGIHTGEGPAGLTVRIRGFSIGLGKSWSRHDGPAGYATADLLKGTALDALIIALAGPLVEIAAGLVAVVVIVTRSPAPDGALPFWVVMVVLGVGGGLNSLRDTSDGENTSDGSKARAAYALHKKHPGVVLGDIAE